MNEEFRKRLLQVTSKLQIRCFIIIGGVQNKLFQDSWQKRQSEDNLSNRETETVTTSLTNDSLDDQNVINDEDISDDDNNQTSNSHNSDPFKIKAKRVKKKNRNLTSTPRLATMKAVAKFLKTGDLSQTHSPTTSYGGKMVTRSASKQQQQHHISKENVETFASRKGRKKKEQQPTEEQQNDEELISFLPGKHFLARQPKSKFTLFLPFRAITSPILSLQDHF